MSGEEVGLSKPRGDLSARVHGARRELLERLTAARVLAAKVEAEGHIEFAASLRGKAHAYGEAEALLAALDQGKPLPTRRKWRTLGRLA